MAYEKAFNEEFAKKLVDAASDADADEVLEREFLAMKERSLALNQARKRMSLGFQEVLLALKDAYPGLDLNDANFIGTPDRMARAMLEVCSGLGADDRSVFSKSFPSGEYNEMIMLKDIEYTSICAHHFFPFTGVAHIGYMPARGKDEEEDGHKVVGVSKLARIVDVYANRPQLQERMCTEIMQAIKEQLNPRGVMVVVEGKHGCIGCRGVKKVNATMITSGLDGAFKTSAKLRSEFLALLKRGNLR
ncbi:MAG: GTP cyclohydrolase I [Oligoflexia bacterium]|nr:GTP cyclohydrolase I [Oligoflexia bacterium]MBF0364879.1 GTP cyclohydrolase I [Oligoflexia bacterium]